jgi:outer membrane immunogenic protein
MKRLLLISASCSVLVSGAAIAADMPLKAPPPVPVVAFDWSGIYVGGDLGWQGSRIGLSSPFPGASLVYAPNHDSFAAGAFIGAQRQFGQVVLGIEGSYMSAFNNANLGATPALSIFFPGGTGTAQAKLRDIWSVGGRLGLAAGRWMPYVTGGYASGSFEFDAQTTPPSSIIFPGSEQAKSNNSGGYFGAGVDWAATDNWILGAEYRHYAFNSKTVTGVVGGPFPFTEPVTFAPRTDTVLARLSYKFNWR